MISSSSKQIFFCRIFFFSFVVCYVRSSCLLLFFPFESKRNVTLYSARWHSECVYKSEMVFASFSTYATFFFVNRLDFVIKFSFTLHKMPTYANLYNMLCSRRTYYNYPLSTVRDYIYIYI